MSIICHLSTSLGNKYKYNSILTKRVADASQNEIKDIKNTENDTF